MRLFIALDIPDETRAWIAQFAEKMSKHASEARWVKPESLHVTLKFLGEVPEGRLVELEDHLQRVSANPFSIALKGAGFFPAAKSARVFWIGVDAPPELAELAHTIDQALVPLGFEPEARPFSPHLTLARTGSGAPSRQRGDRVNHNFSTLQSILSKDPPADFGTITASEFFLFQSRLSPRGATYSKLMRCPLGRTA